MNENYKISTHYNYFYGIFIIVISILSFFIVFKYIQHKYKFWIALLVFIIINIFQLLAKIKYTQYYPTVDCPIKCPQSISPGSFEPGSFEPGSFSPVSIPPVSIEPFQGGNGIFISNYEDGNVIMNGKTNVPIHSPNTGLFQTNDFTEILYSIQFVDDSDIHYFEEYLEGKTNYSSNVYLQSYDKKLYLGTPYVDGYSPGWQSDPFIWTLFNYNYKKESFVTSSPIEYRNMNNIYIVALQPGVNQREMGINIGQDYSWQPHMTNLDNEYMNGWKLLVKYNFSNYIISPKENKSLCITNENKKYILSQSKLDTFSQTWVALTYSAPWTNEKSYVWIMFFARENGGFIGSQNDFSLQNYSYNWEYNGLNIQIPTDLYAKFGENKDKYLTYNKESQQFYFSNSETTQWRFYSP
jgi:hypothetical protein